MNRLELSQKFLTSYFSNKLFIGNKMFLRLNGLIGFPNIEKSLVREEIRIWQVRKMRLISLLSEFLERFNQFNFIFYKGIDIEKKYPNTIARFYSDIDLLCDRATFKKLRRVLNGNSEEVVYRKRGLEIEVKSNFFWHDMSSILPSRRKKYLNDFYKKTNKGISSFDNLILLSIHNFAHQFARLDRFFDIYFLIKDQEPNIRQALNYAEEYNLSQFIRYNLFLLKYLGFPIDYNVILNKFEKFLILSLFNKNKNRYKLLLIMLNLNPMYGVVIFLQKIFFLDIPNTKRMLKNLKNKIKI
jgi:hypothetical protein